MLNSIGDSVSDLASSEDKENRADKDEEEEDTGHCKLSQDDEPSWVMGTYCNTAQHHRERFEQNQKRHDELTQQRWGDAADYFLERDMKSGRTELKIPGVGKYQPDSTAATLSPATFRELMQVLYIVPGQSQIQQVTSRQGS
jgi:hypothetical protein